MGVVVSNAQPDLLAWANSQQAALAPRADGRKPRLMVASRHEAYGILEALAHHGLL